MDRERPSPPLAPSLLLSLLLHALLVFPLLAWAMRPDSARGVEALFDPQPQVEPATEPPAEPEEPLGIDRSEAVTLNWIGYEDYQEHLAKLAEFEQAAFIDEESGGASGVAGESFQPEGTPQEGVEAPAPAPPAPTDPALQSVARGDRSEPTPSGGEAPDSSRDPEAPPERPAGTPAPLAGPDADRPQAPPVPPRDGGEELPSAVDPVPAGAPHDTPRPQPATGEDPAEGPPAESPPTPAPPAEGPEDPAPPEAPQGEEAPTEPSPAEPSPAEPTPDEPTPAEPAPTAPPGAPQTGDPTPAAPGPPRPTPPQPGDAADRESDAFSVITVPPELWRNGRPLAMRGLEIQTRRPVLPLLTQLTTRPQHPVAELRFNREGRVVRATLLSSTGYETVDGPILDSLFRWRARGEVLLRLRDDQVAVYRIRLMLRD
jgi:hypothetical protein